MRNPLFVGVLIIFMISCKKTETGPQGIQGITGPAGSQGPKGLSNQKVFFGRIDPGGWGGRQDCFPGFSNIGHFNVDSATFMVYIDVDGDFGTNNHFWAPMPYVENGQTYSFLVSSPSVVSPNLYYQKNDGGTPIQPTHSYDLKMIVIIN